MSPKALSSTISSCFLYSLYRVERPESSGSRNAVPTPVMPFPFRTILSYLSLSASFLSFGLSGGLSDSTYSAPSKYMMALSSNSRLEADILDCIVKRLCRQFNFCAPGGELGLLWFSGEVVNLNCGTIRVSIVARRLYWFAGSNEGVYDSSSGKEFRNYLT